MSVNSVTIVNDPSIEDFQFQTVVVVYVSVTLDLRDLCDPSPVVRHRTNDRDSERKELTFIPLFGFR